MRAYVHPAKVIVARVQHTLPAFAYSVIVVAFWNSSISLIYTGSVIPAASGDLRSIDKSYGDRESISSEEIPKEEFQAV